jgi:predicted CXXCH cytochrome family protein
VILGAAAAAPFSFNSQRDCADSFVVNRFVGLIALWMALPLLAQNVPVHRSCEWCHAPDITASSARAQGATTPVCLSCHDGVASRSPDVGSSSHSRSGLDCLACHDPHDRSGSYRLLRGKFGPQTAQTAKLQFCRECHSNH